MIKNNLLGQMLLGLLVLFLLLGSLQMFEVGQSIETLEVHPENQMKLPTVPKASEGTVSDSLNDSKQLVGNITARPMFSTDRSPFVLPEENLGGENPEDAVKEPIAEINAKLTGVVITPLNSYAMILDSTTNQRETYKVGMPLDGEQGGWTLTEIQGRKVVFTSDEEETTELELEVFGGSKAKAKGRKDKKGKDGKNSPKQLSKKDKKKNADDIRKKIAERRAQMRAEAAKKKNRR